MAVQFGQLTTSNYIPRAMRLDNDAGMGMINQLNSVYTPDSTGQPGGGPPTLTADVASDYADIRASQGPRQGGGIISTIADWIVGRKIADAQV